MTGQSYKSVETRFYEDESPYSFYGELNAFPLNGPVWQFRLYRKGNAGKVREGLVWKGSLTELGDSLLRNKKLKELAYQEGLEAERTPLEEPKKGGGGR